MKVLHIGLCKNKGGIESFALNYFRELQKRDCVFDFADIYSEGLAEEEEIKRLGGRIISFPNFKRHPIKNLKYLASYMKTSDYDAIHIHIQTAANIIPALAAKRAGIKPIIHTHVSSCEGLLRKFLHLVNLPRLHKINSYRFACGEEAGKWFWKKKKFEVIPNAIDLNKFFFNREIRVIMRKHLCIDEETLVLGFVGRLETVKNPMFALKVLKECRQRYPEKKVKLIVIGDGSLCEELKSFIEIMNLTQDVFLLGYKSNVYDYFSAMDIFLMPSLHEAFSIAAIEAQANGLNCLFSDTLPCELQVLQSCQFLKLGEMSQWANTIAKSVIKNERERIAEGCLILESQYNLQVAGQTLFEIYQNCRLGKKQ